MQKITQLFTVLTLIGATQAAQAVSIDWSGNYRIEYNSINNTSLDSHNPNPKSYGLQTLQLNSKIVASDGVNIIGRFNVMGSQTPGYENSQLGSLLGGSGIGTDPRVTSQNEESSAVNVTHLYLNVSNEYGTLIAGRFPFEFGMGITYNAGNGPFDHWYDNRDGVGYKFYIDNVSFMPMISKTSQKDYGRGVTITDQTFVLEYKNPDNGAEAGVVQQERKSSSESNDGASIPAYGAATVAGNWNTKTVNLYLARKWTSFQFKLETSFLTGETGLVVGGENVGYNAYAIAAELLFPAVDESIWAYEIKTGIASGDNPNTAGKFEGYQFDRNYDVAMLLFNHRLGQADFLTTGITHTNTGLTTANSADDEEIGNTIYFAPSVKYAWNEKFDIKTSLIYAQLATNPTLSVDTQKDLGTELDIELIYKPRANVIWSNEIGVLFPGAAWKDGATGYSNDLTYGLATKAAITF